LDYRRGLSKAVNRVLGADDDYEVDVEKLREGYGMRLLIERPEYQHVGEALDHAYTLGAEKTEKLLKGENVDAETKKVIDDLKAELATLKTELGSTKAVSEETKWAHALDRGEREIRRMFPNATDEQVADFFDNHVRTRGIILDQKQRADWGATARAFKPDVFGGAVAPTGAATGSDAAAALSRPAGNGLTSREEPETFNGPKEGENIDGFKDRARQHFYAQVSAQEG